ncbi:YcaO-like family protein [Streptomyces scabiei]|uniref:YcaO-like family protein n=1 Tax=Streptomyces scabiei TaxID=1930 RepID=UPI00298F297F|nr:YcaO-like family protein [Streptomyces scabiei]MDW8478332.1 YcaO-like family protein [Streptomyces scabiei]
MPHDDDVLALPGTLRARPPEQTWQMVKGHLSDYGITRLARLTGLDGIGLPVWTAIRPASLTLSTSQGKGATDDLARLSAVLEAIELWHVEQPMPLAAYGPAEKVAPLCPVAELPLTVPHSHRTLSRVVWEWTAGTGLISGAATLLPVDLVRRRAHRPEWSPDLLRATSTGLACGNTRDEALVHALAEVVERDVLYRDAQSGGQRRTLIDPATVEDPFARDVLGRFEAAGMNTELFVVDGPYGLPVCTAYLWSEDHPAVFAGGGCHLLAGIAATRALTEAAQSRLTVIAGTRDDLSSEPADFATPPVRPLTRRPLTPWPQATGHFPPVRGGFADHVRHLARQVAHVTGHEPVALDLSAPGAPVHAVQVVCPGTRSRIRRAMPR